MISPSDQQYLTLRNRLYRQLDSYGLRKKGKENKPADIKLKVAKSSNLFLVKERQPVCQSNNPVLQICLEASLGDPDEFRELILNKSAMKQQRSNGSSAIGNSGGGKKQHERTKSSMSNRTYSEQLNSNNRKGRSRTIKDITTNNHSNASFAARKQFYRSGVQSANRKSVIDSIRYQGWQPPSEAIGVVVPKVLLLDATQKMKKRRMVERSALRKRYEALEVTNQGITLMWKRWDMSASRCRMMPMRSRENERQKEWV